MNTPADDVVRPVPQIDDYFGLLIKLSRTFWGQVPEQFRGWLSFEDVLGEAIVRFYQVAPKYHEERGAAFSTFLYTSVQNHLTSYIQRFRTGMRTGIHVDYEDVHFQLMAPQAPDERMVEAEVRVERVLQVASMPLLQYIKYTLFGSCCANLTDEIRVEMRRVCHMTGATQEDFRLLMGVASIH